jgi:hypothetical protein
MSLQSLPGNQQTKTAAPHKGDCRVTGNPPHRTGRGLSLPDLFLLLQKFDEFELRECAHLIEFC